MHLNLFEAALGVAAVLAVPMAAAGLMSGAVDHTVAPMAETVEIAATEFDFPLPGEFLAGGKPVAALVEKVEAERFLIMKHQVSLAEYGRCVEAGACQPADAVADPADVPVTGVSYFDAHAYAQWYSQATGAGWRLPTAVEAAAAAGERFTGDALSAAADDPSNPAVGWIRRYREAAAEKRVPDPRPKQRGFYGANANRVEDFGGNVWEWTSTCYVRVSLSGDRSHFESSTDNCGVHVLEGRHRTYVSNFVRDGKSGGCAVGTPPENLGFRLVRDEGVFSGIIRLATDLKSAALDKWTRRTFQGG